MPSGYAANINPRLTEQLYGRGLLLRQARGQASMTTTSAATTPGQTRLGDPRGASGHRFCAAARGQRTGNSTAWRQQVHDACRDTGFFTVGQPPGAGTLDRRGVRGVEALLRPAGRRPHGPAYGVVGQPSGAICRWIAAASSGNMRGRAVPGFQLHLDEDTRKAREAKRKRFNNLNDAFQISAELPPEDPDVRGRQRPLHGLNLWPDLPNFREPLLDYYETMRRLRDPRMARVFRAGTRCRTRPFHAPLQEAADAAAPAWRYLPAARSRDRARGPARRRRRIATAAASPLLQQDSTGGLEIQTRSGEWVVVPPIENSFVVNIGDTLKAVDQQPVQLDTAPGPSTAIWRRAPSRSASSPTRTMTP